ncbi:polysaccharide biosynthesis protein [Micromonospora tarensis]|uniref:Polysaccharide biosynthesis protein n=1 Tax=Micromonospora tarensis TaxID=2806100 RepID=A0ABS1YIS2_9ACTN|nr:polysaccharide biosynthesis protein [Micromonospora tarensis]MBM0277051.1 polysaccharide biosynthesis protein [Micromonospora tarensis]
MSLRRPARPEGTVGTEPTAGLGVAGVSVTLAGVLVNGLAYLVPVLAARRLDPADLSALAAALGLVAIVSVPGLGLQLAVAVHRARHGSSDTRRLTAFAAAACAGTLVVATPLLVAALDLPVEVPALLAVSAAAIVLSSRSLGELQGSQRFLRLASGMAVLALARYGGVIAGLLLGAGLSGALAAGALTAALAPAVLARLARAPGPPSVAPPLTVARVAAGCGATLAMLVVSYADLLLARQLLPPSGSGAYSVGTVLSKGALWAPQVAAVLALPRLARGDRRSRTVALLVTGACGLVLVLISTLAGGLAFRLAGGPDYAHLGRYAPLFAAVGALYAVTFVLLNDRLAAGVRWPAAPLWVGTAGLVTVAATLRPRTVPGLLLAALGTAVVTTLAMALTARRLTPRRASPPEDGGRSRPPDPASGRTRPGPAAPPG